MAAICRDAWSATAGRPQHHRATGRRSAPGRSSSSTTTRKIVRLVRMYLERERYRVVEAYDGATALDAFEANDPAASWCST